MRWWKQSASCASYNYIHQANVSCGDENSRQIVNSVIILIKLTLHTWASACTKANYESSLKGNRSVDVIAGLKA